MKPTFFARYALVILVLGAFLMPICTRGARLGLASNRNDVQDWLPAEYAETQTFKWFQKHFAGEQFLLASWEGCTLDDERLGLLTRKVAGLSAESINPDDRRPLFDADRTVTGALALSRMTSEPISLSRDEALQRLRGALIGPDGQQTCAVFVLSEAGELYARKAVDAVRRLAIEECNIPADQLHMGGPPRDNAAIDEAGESSLLRLAVLAGGVGLFVSWWCLRSGKLLMMVFCVGIYSAAASLAVVWYSRVEMNAILLTMPSLVYVAAVSGAIHLANFYRETLQEEGPVGAPERAVKHAMLPLSLAAGTTAVGLASLCFSELVPIKLFGLFSAIGVLLSLAFLVFYFPAALQMWPLKPRPADATQTALDVDPLASPHWWVVARFIVNRNIVVAGACLLVMVAIGLGIPRIQTSVQLMRMFSGKAPILDDYRWLEQHLGELVPMEVVVAVDQQRCPLDFLEKMELVERVQKRVEAIPEVGSTLSAVTFAPHLPKPEDYRRTGGMGGAATRLLGIRDPYKTARKIMAERLAMHRNEYLSEGYLSEDGDTELWRVTARVAALRDVDFGAFQEEVRQAVEEVVGDEATQHQAGINIVYTGLVPLVYKAQRSLLDGLLYGFAADVLLVTLVMIIAVRNLSAGVLLFLPSIFPMIVVFGLMGWCGVIVDVGTVMAPAVALGVTVDDVMHFLLKFRGGLIRGMNRRDAVMYAYQGCAQPMYQSWGVIGIGLSVFALSPFTPTQRFGVLMVTLLSAALVGNLVLLPALLASPLGALFARRYTQQTQPTDGEAGGPPDDDAPASPVPASPLLGMPHWRAVEERLACERAARLATEG